MILIITNEDPNVVNSLNDVCKSLDVLKIPYEIVGECRPNITKRKNICGLIFPGRRSRILPYNIQDRLDLELFYLCNFPNTPILGLCHGCQLLMLFYGGEIIIHDSYWIRNTTIELDISKKTIFKNEERKQKLFVHFHDLPAVTPAASKAGVQEIAWIIKFRDGQKHACAFEFEKNRVYGFMFHPEHIEKTYNIISNFYHIICSGSSSSS